MPSFIDKWIDLSIDDCMYPPWMKDRGLSEWERYSIVLGGLTTPLESIQDSKQIITKVMFSYFESASNNVIYCLIFLT